MASPSSFRSPVGRRVPDFDDTLRYVTIAGESAVFENEADGRHYECVLFRDQSGTSGCTRVPIVGDRAQVAERGLVVDRYCTGYEIGYIKLTNRCTYRCGIAPLEE